MLRRSEKKTIWNKVFVSAKKFFKLATFAVASHRSLLCKKNKTTKQQHQRSSSSFQQANNCLLSKMCWQVNGREVGRDPRVIQEELQAANGIIVLKILPSYHEAIPPRQVRDPLQSRLHQMLKSCCKV